MNNLPILETYLRKVFVGGLPQNIDEDEINEHLVKFGPLIPCSLHSLAYVKLAY